MSTALLAILFAVMGFMIQIAIVLLIGFGPAWRDFLPSVATSFVGLIVSAYIFGYIAHRSFSGTNSRNRTIFIGAIVGWAVLWVQVLCGSSVEYFRNIRSSGAFVDYVFKPTFWVIFLGTIPSLLLGCIFGGFVWRRIRKNLQ